MQDHLVGLRLPDNEVLEAGEDCSKEEPERSYGSSWVPPRIEPRVQPKHNRCQRRPVDNEGPVTSYPEEANGNLLWETFEGPDERLVDRDFESGNGFIRDGFQVEELLEEAEERAERFMVAQRQLALAFFARRKNSFYLQAATKSLRKPDQVEPKLLILWNLLQDRWFDADPKTQDEVNCWVSTLNEKDFFFFTQSPEMDPQKIMASGILPRDLRPLRLFKEQRRKLIRALMRETDFFHSDNEVFETRFAKKLPQICSKWNLEEKTLRKLAFEERSRLYLLHLAICKAAAAFARSKPAPAHVPPEIVAEVAAVAYGRMDHPTYKAQALDFGNLQADRAKAILAKLGGFMEEFYASRLFSFLKRAMLRRRMKTVKFDEKPQAKIGPTVEIFVKSFRTGFRPKGLDEALAKQRPSYSTSNSVQTSNDDLGKLFQSCRG